MKVQIKNPVYTIKSFPTNGVLRCISGALPTDKTEKNLQNTEDIITTIKHVFNYTNNDFKNLIDSNNFLGAFLITIGAGKQLEKNNPLLKPLTSRLMDAKLNGDINKEIEKLVNEIGEHINLKA